MHFSYEFTAVDIAIGLGIVVVIVVFFVARWFARQSRLPEGLDRKFYRARWKEIEALVELKKEMNYKLAVIEADKLLDSALRGMYFTGTTMAERLKLASYKFPKLKQVWWAHQVRNHVVHDVRYELRHGEAKKVLDLFKRAMNTLGVL